MKKQLFLLTVLFYNFIGFTQNSFEVVYKAVLLEQKFDKKEKSFLGESAKVLTQMLGNSRQLKNEILKDFNFVLRATPDESEYFWEEETPDETVSRGDFNSAIRFGGGFGVHYQNKKENIYITQYRYMNKWHREYENLYDDSWKITKETDTILGYFVIKAIKIKKLKIKAPNPLIKTVIKTEVWFAPALPIPFGPNGLGGLPGLILKFKRNNSVIYAAKIKLLKNKIKIKRPRKGKLVSIKDATTKRIKQLDKIIRD